MKRVDKPNAIILWNGEPVRVVAIAQGKTIHMVPLDKSEPCSTCGFVKEISALEHSPLFQDTAEPVNTIIEEQA